MSFPVPNLQGDVSQKVDQAIRQIFAALQNLQLQVQKLQADVDQLKSKSS